MSKCKTTIQNQSLTGHGIRYTYRSPSPSTHLHPKSLTSNLLQDIYYSIERIDYGVPAYLYVYFLMLIEHLQTTNHTLILAHTKSSFSHKISCPSLLVKEQGVVLYSDPTSIYFYLSNYLSNPLNKHGEIALFYLYNKIKPCYLFYQDDR